MSTIYNYCINCKDKTQIIIDGYIISPPKEYRPVHCTFDLPLCGLVNDWTSSGAKWTERTGPVSDRGPQTDHSNGAGKENIHMYHDYRYHNLKYET